LKYYVIVKRSKRKIYRTVEWSLQRQMRRAYDPPKTRLARIPLRTSDYNRKTLLPIYWLWLFERVAFSFIRSQQGEGWRMIKTHYDDGGLSGATMDRLLQNPLEDIRQKLIDVVVVYKVHRLTRSLSDFVRMVEVFDAYGVSFVAVTQQFNTTTSMGRLTLNVLLSFAQFEREVTGERIRDKTPSRNARHLDGRSGPSRLRGSRPALGDQPWPRL
jgi:hypothetical protein